MSRKITVNKKDIQIIMGSVTPEASYITSPVFASMKGQAKATISDQNTQLYTTGLTSCVAVAVASNTSNGAIERRLIHLPGGLSSTHLNAAKFFSHLVKNTNIRITVIPGISQELNNYTRENFKENINDGKAPEGAHITIAKPSISVIVHADGQIESGQFNFLIEDVNLTQARNRPITNRRSACLITFFALATLSIVTGVSLASIAQADKLEPTRMTLREIGFPLIGIGLAIGIITAIFGLAGKCKTKKIVVDADISTSEPEAYGSGGYTV